MGREREDNLKINEYKDYATLFIRGKEVPGPHIIGIGELRAEEIEFALTLFSRYSKVKGEKEVTLLINGEDITIQRVDMESLNSKIKRYQII